MSSQLSSQFTYATAAPQIEGAWNTDGKGPSIWDTLAHTPGKILDNSNADDACRSYDFYRQDVALMKSYGVTAYRFSLSWSRIIPLGGKDDPINEAGIQFYSNLIDELLANGITPFVTLFHWDMPQALEDRYKSMLNQSKYIPDFLRYARVCFERLGDRVKHWITYNEPGVYTLAGYAGGAHAPGRSSNREQNEEGDTSTEPWIVGHTQLVSHGYAVDMYRKEFQPSQKGTIGITLSGNWSEPWDKSDAADRAAAQRALEFEIAWFADPVYGPGKVDYPGCMRKQLGERLPQFTEEEKRLVRGSSEFYGMNTYTSFFVKDNIVGGPIPPEDHKGNLRWFNENKDGVSRGEESDTEWLRTAPWGFRKLLRWIWERYHVPIYVTENGTTVKGEDKLTEKLLNDRHRIEFYRKYVGELAKAVKDGIDIRSYFGWTLADNWEWAKGYTDRFGVTFIDFDTPEKKRYPKRSAAFNRDFFKHLIAKS
ncbi:glycoside hydrolase family 1 protein [Zopfia rhizophila CBS 207.26]|uniref:beta-glucosidase n=1 Tax=Zopfia rhizophila CBS 207.26 TaxID=1314779 RepID=A0A6A6DP67_9PEZI|nr:glycoside hydrolase family 1 protein [Zopfia rhizophila CBS 207.26]